MAYFNPRRAAYQQDPYPALARLRAEEPVHRSPDFGAWVVTSYAECAAVLRDRETFAADPGLASNAMGRTLSEHRANVPLGEAPTFGSANPLLHAHLRSLTRGPFALGAVERQREAIDEMADEMAAQLPEDEPFDLMATVADPLPAAAVLDFLGVPAADQREFRRWVSLIEHARVNPGVSHTLVAGAQYALGALDQYVERLPATTMLGGLMRRAGGNEGVSRSDLLSVIVQMALVGNGPTAGLIANGLIALARNPGEIEVLRADPELLPRAIHELVRYDSPSHSISRVALEDTSVGGRNVRKGEMLFAMVGAANRDPAVFEDPDRLDVHRDARQQLGFGMGVHFCLGAPLARMLAESALSALLSRFREVRLASVEYGGAFELRVPDRVLLIGR